MIPVSKESKPEAEAQQLELLRKHKIDLVVLARYMQVLSNDFIEHYPRPIINIHHSFLPAFVGAKPHQQAFDRGVKLIGATAHYVTEVLDDGPIIEQDVVRISHKDDIDDLVEKGRDLEKVVLSRSVRWHIENRILLYGNKTVIFD
jgi:formyltetrahydrofolate deformylase